MTDITYLFKKGRRSNRFPFFECLDYLGDKRMSDNVFVPESYCLDSLDVLCEFYAFQQS